MLKIRLRKPGKSIKGRRHFKIVVCEARCSRESKMVEEKGHYNPSQKHLKIDLSKYQEWIKKGAHPTETVASLAKKYKREYKTE